MWINIVTMTTTDKKKRTNIFEDLYNLLTSHTKPLYIKRLFDGSVYVYSKDHLLASFRYYGGTSIVDLRLNTKSHIGKVFKARYYMGDYIMPGGDRLRSYLKELLPEAVYCYPTMRNAYEYSILESALLDLSTCIEVSNIKKHSYDVALVNNESYVSSSFRYYPNKGLVTNLFLRYHSRVPDVKGMRIKVPFIRRHVFSDLLTRDLKPID